MHQITYSNIICTALILCARIGEGSDLSTQDVEKLHDGLRHGGGDAESAIILRELRDGGPQASLAAPTIIQLIGDERQDRYLRRLAIEVIDAHADSSARAVPVLTAIVEAEDDALAAQAAITLGTIGQATEEVGRALSTALTRASAGRLLQREAAHSLGLLRPPGKEAVPALTTALRRAKNDPELQVEIAKALTAFGAGARESVHVFALLLRDATTQANVAREIVDALAAIAAQVEKRASGFGAVECVVWLRALKNSRDALRTGHFQDVDDAVAAHDSAIAGLENRLREWDVGPLWIVMLMYIVAVASINLVSCLRPTWLELNPLWEIWKIKLGNWWILDFSKLRFFLVARFVVSVLRFLCLDIRYLMKCITHMYHPAKLEVRKPFTPKSGPSVPRKSVRQTKEN